ncbi:BMP family lipoprotein [Lysinibacter cavernae]|uniref:Basic membrane protein A n=1 Tax=Lysinibacter cavernae TaxID=1640652 RepID=A0A7X5R3U9_9MICO|nr:BMP family ABC transporter substrate-binding protein [Lysinibacter cavernae]NIH55170.1 basic membrane protein A [Lysinibacter cavernae]
MKFVSRVGIVAGLAAVALVLSGCQQGEKPKAAASPEPTQPAYCARMVTSSGELKDRSFNQSTWNGLEDAKDELGIQVKSIVSEDADDFAANLAEAVESECGLVVSVGSDLTQPTARVALQHPTTNFVVVDADLSGAQEVVGIDSSEDDASEPADADGESDVTGEATPSPSPTVPPSPVDVSTVSNLKPVVFETQEASFLAGYVAAGVSKNKIVATFGGEREPHVIAFMDGFAAGVAAYNVAHNDSVVVLGWNQATGTGTFDGGYDDSDAAKGVAKAFIEQGADVIMPVAGQAGEGAASAALESGNVLLVWVDSDGFETLPDEYGSIVLTSVLKNAANAMDQIVRDDMAGEFDQEAYVGTLANGGVGIAPFHDQELAVNDVLAAEVEALRQGVISGEIEPVVGSPASPSTAQQLTP